MTVHYSPLEEDGEDDFRPSDDELGAFEEKANQIFETFLESMKDDPKYVRPYDPEEDPSDAEGCKWMWRDRATTLIDHMLSRLRKLAEKKFGAYAIDIDIECYLYKEF